jgi:hypothetical protein
MTCHGSAHGWHKHAANKPMKHALTGSKVARICCCSMQVVKFITSGRRLPMPSRDAMPGPESGAFEGLDGYIALMNRCWAQNPEDRPTFHEISDCLR